MVKNNPRNKKWLWRYRTFFLIGALILAFQIFLGASFLSINKSVVEQHINQWEPSNYESSNDAPIFARKLDEEDAVSPSVISKKNKNQSIHSQIRVEELDFALPCSISNKEAVSAINRAKTQQCKQFIANITCLSLRNELYPKELPSSCPALGAQRGKQLGCFKDEKDFRLLSGYYGVNKVENSPKYCMKLCLQSGFPYAGVQYSNECFCGIDEPPISSKIPDSSCNMKCPADELSTCGGYYTMNVFQTGIKKFVPQVALEGMESKKPVKIVFLLTLNGRALRQVRRLIKILYHSDHYYYIHVDVRQDYLFRELLPLEKLPNIRLTRKRFATIWGGASLLEMLRSCMQELLQFTSWKWEFILNLSESDFPIKTVSELTKFLSANRDKNFVKSHGREVQRFIQKQGLDKTFVECETRMWRVSNRQLPFGIQIDGGSDWIALSRNFVEYVANSQPDELISGLLKIFKHTLLPAESFFHTALRNSRFCNTYVDNNLHVTNWKRKLGCKCQYKHVVDWCGCSPNDFTPDDWPRILNTQYRQLYFARKFEPIINQAVILKLELWLYNLEQPSRQVENLYSYWQSVYHYRDLGVSHDDTLMTFSESIKRKIMKMFGNNSVCDEILTDLLEVTTFHHKDTYKYTLFNFKGSKSNIEAAVKPLNKIKVIKALPILENLSKLFVSTDFDQKEQVSRNFLQLVSPFTDPVLVYRFSKVSKQYNFTCLFVNPVGRLQDVTDFSIDENSLVGHVKPGLRQRHMPGIWLVKLIYKNSLIAQIEFLVLPLNTIYGNPISEAQHSQLYSSLSQNNREFNANYSKFLPDISEKQVLEEAVNSNSKMLGYDLRNLIDSLVSQFYTIEKVCVSSELVSKICEVRIEQCVKTNWSSFSPDSKSAITNVNKTTGMFDIW